MVGNGELKSHDRWHMIYSESCDVYGTVDQMIAKRYIIELQVRSISLFEDLSLLKEMDSDQRLVPIEVEVVLEVRDVFVDIAGQSGTAQHQYIRLRS